MSFLSSRSFWKRTALTVSCIVVALILVALLTATWVVWRRFPPSDAVSGWTLVAGVAAAISALAATALAVLAFRGLASLRIARDEIVHRASIAAKNCAILRLEEIAKEIIPLNTKVLDGLAAENIKVFLGQNDSVVLDPDPKDLTNATKWRDSLPVYVYNRIITLLNRLEAWSVYFTEGVADADVAFGPIGPLLRSWVGQYYAVLLILRAGTGSASGKFPNLVQLYTVWSARMDAEQLARLHKDLEGQMKQAKDRLEQAAPLPSIVPKIGP